jgi:hypothetical protein
MRGMRLGRIQRRIFYRRQLAGVRQTLDPTGRGITMDENQQRTMSRLCLERGHALAELRKAHAIIRNALNLMTPTQKSEWGRANARDDVDGDGITRANERAALIETLSKDIDRPEQAATLGPTFNACADDREVFARLRIRDDTSHEQKRIDAGYCLDAPVIMPAGSVRLIDAAPAPPFAAVSHVGRHG